jgi:hypothetical protein
MSQELDERLHGRRHPRVVTDGHQIEQQPTGDGKPQAGQRRIDGSPAGHADLGEPAFDGVGRHAGERLFALRATGIALEEQSLEMPQSGLASANEG